MQYKLIIGCGRRELSGVHRCLGKKVDRCVSVSKEDPEREAALMLMLVVLIMSEPFSSSTLVDAM